MNLNKNSKVRAVGISSSFALLALLGLAFFCPNVDGANAATDLNRSSTFNLDFVLNKYDTKTFTIDFYVSSALSLTLHSDDPDVSASVNPTPSGQTVANSTNFSVTSNSSEGYNIYVYKEGATANDRALTSSGSTDKIMPATDIAPTLAGLSNNTWGYNLTPKTNDTCPATASLEYSPIANKNNVVPFHGSKEAATHDYCLTYGAKVDYNITPGDYTNSVNVQVVAGAELNTLSNETYSLPNGTQQGMQNQAQSNQSE